MDTLLICPNNHYYDGNEYRSCPYCQQSTVRDGGTVPVQNYGDEYGVGSTAKIGNTPAQPQVDDIDPTFGTGVFVDGAGAPIKLITGWLVCTEGSQKGKDFRICAGRNYIGRGADMDICLADDKSVSRNRHAIVIFDPVSQNTLCQAGESRELFYHNGKVVTDTAVLSQGDILQIGNSKLVFVPFCGAVHTW